jgi:hypothetical protein
MARGQECRGELVEMLEMPEAESNGERVEVRRRLQADVREIEDYCEEVETERDGIERRGRIVDFGRRLSAVCSGLWEL